MPHDSLCNEGFKNVYLVGVRNVEGQNTYGHTVPYDLDSEDHMQSSILKVCQTLYKSGRLLHEMVTMLCDSITDVTIRKDILPSSFL